MSIKGNKVLLITTASAFALGAIGLSMLLLNISQRKSEERNSYVRLKEVGEDDTDPALW